MRVRGGGFDLKNQGLGFALDRKKPCYRLQLASLAFVIRLMNLMSTSFTLALSGLSVIKVRKLTHAKTSVGHMPCNGGRAKLIESENNHYPPPK